VDGWSLNPKVGMTRELILMMGIALAACDGNRREGMICLSLSKVEAEAAAATAPTLFQAEPPFVEVWSAVAGGQANAGSAGEWRMDRLRDGSVRTWRATVPLSEGDGAPEDGALRRAVLTRLAEQPLLRDLRLEVRATNGMVHLEGTVTNAVIGAEAVRVALATPGVRVVVSRLYWPAATAPPPP
jgi:osmotically-inducible protein OsmY